MSLISLNLNTPPAERRGNALENPSVSLGNLGAIWSWINGTEPTASGELIDHDIALHIITVYSCVRLIAETVGSLPLKLYERLNKGRSEAIDNYLYSILTVSANPEMSSVVFWETTVGCMALTGNAYTYIQRGAAGQVIALWPLNPKHTRPVRMPTGELAFETTEGMANGGKKVYPASDIMHFRLFGWDGLLGLSPIMLARQSLGLTRATEKMGSRLFANGGRPSGVMTQEGMGPNAKQDEKMLLNLRESWQAAQTGDNALKTAFLPGSWKYTAIGLDMEDIQFLATRQFQRAEIATGLFHVPAHLVGDTTRQSNTNSEQEALTLVTLTLRPYLYKIENEIQRVLLPSVGRNANRFFVEFDTTALLRGDTKTLYETYAIGKQWGFLNTNEIKEDQGQMPIGPVGDVYWTPVNFQNSENLLVKPAPALPAPVDDSTTGPTDTERNIVRRVSIVMPVFRDAMGRLLNRSQKDLGTITGIFEPVLRSIATLSAADASVRNGLEWADEATIERIVRDACKGIEKRADKWTSKQADEVAPDEFRKVLRAIVSAVYREVGAALVATDEEDIKDD